MRKDGGARGNQVFPVKGKCIFFQKDTVISEGFSRVLLSRLHETCDRTTQLLLKSCKDIGISNIGTDTTLVAECVNRSDADQIEEADIIKQCLKIITGSIWLLLLFFKEEDWYYCFGSTGKNKNGIRSKVRSSIFEKDWPVVAYSCF